MKFYVNQIGRNHIIPDTPYGEDRIGLFGEHGFEGRGNFCGWYGSEWYLDTKLYAHYIADGGGLYSPEKRISDVTVCDPPVKFDEVMVGSCYWERVIYADTVEEAIEKFKNADWWMRGQKEKER